MKNQVVLYEHPQFGVIRQITIKNGVDWFVAKDIAESLEYSNPQKAVRDHVHEEDRTVNETFTVNGTSPVLINESGLYALVFGSKMEKAVDFKRWVTYEVIPSIRKTGEYKVMSKSLDSHKSTKRPTKLQRQRVEIATKAERRRTAELWHKFGEMASNQAYKDICVCYGTAELAGKEVLALPEATEKTYTATEIGRMLGVSANKIGKLANTHGLKTEEYGKLFYDKAAHTHKQVETFRYYEKAIAKFRELLEAA